MTRAVGSTEDAPRASGPFVRAALLCERVLCETDETLSAIRILHEAVTDGGTIRVVLLLMLVRGDAEAGSRTAMLELRGPGGQAVSRRAIALELDAGGPEQASSLVIDVSFEPADLGVYWFRLAWGDDGRLLTQVPFTVRAATPSALPVRGAPIDAAR